MRPRLFPWTSRFDARLSHFYVVLENDFQLHFYTGFLATSTKSGFNASPSGHFLKVEYFLTGLERTSPSGDTHTFRTCSRCNIKYQATIQRISLHAHISNKDGVFAK